MGNTFPRPEDDFHDVCVTTHDPNGPVWLQYTGRGLQWVTFVLSWAQLAFYGYQSLRTTLGWEETYVCVIEAIKITLDIFFMYSTPATIYQTNGNTVSWLTYSEWLLTCPVILVHLCNITGLESDFTHRTMQVLVSDVGAIVLGIYAAFSEGWLKMLFFFLGCCYGGFTFYHAAKIYVESYHIVPKGVCRNLVKYMAWCFYISWVGFPIIFVAGPDGLGKLSIWAEVAAQQLCELLAKNVWGLLGHLLRVKIHEHIVKFGDVRKAEKVKFAGKEKVVMAWVEEDDEEGDTVRQSTQPMVTRRESFVKVRDNLKQRGIQTRKSMDGIKFDPELAREASDIHCRPAFAGHVKDVHHQNMNNYMSSMTFSSQVNQEGMAEHGGMQQSPLTMGTYPTSWAMQMSSSGSAGPNLNSGQQQVPGVQHSLAPALQQQQMLMLMLQQQMQNQRQSQNNLPMNTASAAHFPTMPPGPKAPLESQCLAQPTQMASIRPEMPPTGEPVGSGAMAQMATRSLPSDAQHMGHKDIPNTDGQPSTHASQKMRDELRRTLDRFQEELQNSPMRSNSAMN